MQALIDRVYEAFESYATLAHMDGCPCCTEPDGLGWLIQAPLRELEVKHLDLYVGDALLTVGDVPAFKHFLPRLLEILAGDLEAFTMPVVLLSKLTLAEWGSWPHHEHAAVDALLRAIWLETIRSEDDDDFDVHVDTALCALGQAYDDLTWCLELWESDEHPAASRQLALFVHHNEESLASGRGLACAFWEEREVQANQVVDWLSRLSDEGKVAR